MGKLRAEKMFSEYKTFQGDVERGKLSSEDKHFHKFFAQENTECEIERACEVEHEVTCECSSTLISLISVWMMKPASKMTS